MVFKNELYPIHFYGRVRGKCDGRLQNWPGIANERPKFLAMGHLQHACKVVRYGRSFLRRMINLSTVAKKPHHHTRLSRSFRADLAWWSVFLEAWNGISVMHEQQINMQQPPRSCSLLTPQDRGAAERFVPRENGFSFNGPQSGQVST